MESFQMKQTTCDTRVDKTGQRPKRDDIGRYHDRGSFEKPPDEIHETEKSRKKKYWNDLPAQRILSILCNDDKHNYSTDDIQDAYNDRYRDDSSNASLSKTKATKTLNALKNDALVLKVEGPDNDKMHWWKAEHPIPFGLRCYEHCRRDDGCLISKRQDNAAGQVSNITAAHHDYRIQSLVSDSLFGPEDNLGFVFSGQLLVMYSTHIFKLVIRL